MKALGTQSVRSPVGNVLAERPDQSYKAATKGVMSDIVQQFSDLYQLQLHAHVDSIQEIMEIRTESFEGQNITKIAESQVDEPEWMAAQIGTEAIVENREIKEDIRKLRVSCSYHETLHATETTLVKRLDLRRNTQIPSIKP